MWMRRKVGRRGGIDKHFSLEYPRKEAVIIAIGSFGQMPINRLFIDWDIGDCVTPAT